MSDGPHRCTGCLTDVPGRADYCPACGLQIRMACPACSEHTLLLAGMADRATPWCVERETVLYACKSCGRWYLPGTAACDNPACQGSVVPTRPVHTGRRWDGLGSAVGWELPETWTAQGASAPGEYRWDLAGSVHAAATAHNGLYAWAGTAFHLAGRARGNHEWSTAVGPNTQPPPTLPLSERIAVVGPTAVLAEKAGFLAVALVRPSEPLPLQGGAPLAQVGAPHFWAGWTRDGDDAALWLAAVPFQWNLLLPDRVTAPAEAALAPGGTMVADGRRALWPGRDGGLWQLDTVARTVGRVPGPEGDALTPWVAAREPCWIRQAGGSLTIGAAPSEGRASFEAHVGAPPLRGVYCEGGLALVVASRITAFDLRAGTQAASPAMLPAGEWRAGVAARTAAGAVWLLGLSRSASVTALTAVNPLTGFSRVVWRTEGIVPLAMIPAGRRLWIVHSQGLIGLDKEGA